MPLKRARKSQAKPAKKASASNAHGRPGYFSVKPGFSWVYVFLLVRSALPFMRVFENSVMELRGWVRGVRGFGVWARALLGGGGWFWGFEGFVSC